MASFSREKKSSERKFIFESLGRGLSSLEKEHISELKEWRNSQMAVLRQYTPLTDFHQKKWHAHLKEDRSQVLFSLFAKNDNEPDLIGYCGLTNIDSKNRRGEISFLIDPARACKKEIYEKDFEAAMEMLCEYGFRNLNLHKIFTETFDFRGDHIKVIEGFGFCKEGELRDHCFVSGKYFNSIIHSLLFSEWEIINSKKDHAVEK